MALKELDIRQSETRILQNQLNSATVTRMDSTLASINNELTPPGRLIAQTTPSLVVSVGSATVVNPNTSKNRVLPLLNGTVINFTSGTITFPSTSGTITVSPGSNQSIIIGANQFVAVLVQLDISGNLQLSVGTAAGSLAAAVVPSGVTTDLYLGYIVVQSNGSSVIQNVTNSMIYQFVGEAVNTTAATATHGTLTIDSSSGNLTVTSGNTLFYPDLTIANPDVYTVNGSLISVNVNGSNGITVNGTLTINGSVRVLN